MKLSDPLHLDEGVGDAEVICLNTKNEFVVTNTGSEPISDFKVTVVDTGLSVYVTPSYDQFKLEAGESITFKVFVLANETVPDSNSYIEVTGLGGRLKQIIDIQYTAPTGPGTWTGPNTVYDTFRTTSYGFICVNKRTYTVFLNLPPDIDLSKIEEVILIMNFQDRCKSVQPHDTIVTLNGHEVKTWIDTNTVGEYIIPIDKSILQHTNRLTVKSENYHQRGHFCANTVNTLALVGPQYKTFCRDVGCPDVEPPTIILMRDLGGGIYEEIEDGAVYSEGAVITPILTITDNIDDNPTGTVEVNDGDPMLYTGPGMTLPPIFIPGEYTIWVEAWDHCGGRTLHYKHVSTSFSIRGSEPINDIDNLYDSLYDPSEMSFSDIIPIITNNPRVIWVMFKSHVINDINIDRVDTTVCQHEPTNLCQDFPLVKQIEPGYYANELTAINIAAIDALISAYFSGYNLPISTWLLYVPDMFWEDETITYSNGYEETFDLNPPIRIPTLYDTVYQPGYGYGPCNELFFRWDGKMHSDPFDVLITDPLGRRIGTININGEPTIINEIPNAINIPDFIDEESNWTYGYVIIDDPLNGRYKADVYGLKSSNYSLLRTWWVNGTLIQKERMENVSIAQNETHSYEFIFAMPAIGSITNLTNTTYEQTYINWAWTNPTDPDFSHVKVYVDGALMTDTSSEFYNATGFLPETTHEISTLTVDTSGNINTTWINHTATTATISYNNAPVANANGPYTGNEGSEITFDGSGSNDPDDDELQYRWDFNSDGAWDTEWSSYPTASYTLDDDWSGTVKLEVSDGEFNDTNTATVTVNNAAPIVEAGPDKAVNEGDSVSFSGSFTDPGINDTHTIEWNFGDDSNETGTLSPTHVYGDNGVYTVTLTITDSDGGIGTDTLIVTVNNVPPTIDSFTGSLDPVQVGNDVSLNGTFNDPGLNDTHTATFDWDDNTSTDYELLNGEREITGTHTYTDAGVYTVTLTIEDDYGGTDSEVFRYIVVYDPEGGFVTGGGWIISPEGAYAPDPTLTGKANFGFVSKYKQGQQTPTGNTEFQFKAGDLNFHSSDYDWLVIAGHKAMYKGTGTINGAGNYGFMISAIDEDLTPSTDVDLFRIKIWGKDDGDAIVYDNLMGAEDDADPETEIGGGQIKIHKGE